MMEFHPVTENYPLVEGNAREEMLEDLLKHGLIVPIVLWQGKIIDGRNREILCEEAGIEKKYTTWEGKEEDLQDYVESLNEHRRHLTYDQLKNRREKRIARIVDKRAAGKSLRQIAEEEGISHEQVRQDLISQSTANQLTTEGYDTSVNQLTTEEESNKPKAPPKAIDTIREWAKKGHVGKRALAELELLPHKSQKEFVKLVQEGKKPADAIKEISRNPGDDKPPPPPKQPLPKDVILDQKGTLVPDHLRDAFADPGLPILIEELEQIEVMIKPESWLDRAGKLCDHYGFILLDNFKENIWEALHVLQIAIEALQSGLPYAICPLCKGIDSKSNGNTCQGCRGYGHVPLHRFSELTEGDQA